MNYISNWTHQALGIVLYNPKDDFLNNLIIYINKYKFIYINDNSDQRSLFIEKQSISNKNIKYTFNNKNLGIAKSLNLICNEAIKDKNDNILLLDQDSVILNFDYIKLIEFNSTFNNNIGIISLSYFNSFDKSNFINKKIVMTSGSIINLHYWKKVSGFEEKLFIDEVDHDYCIKLINNNYTIIATTSKFLKHEVGFVKSHNIMNLKTINISFHDPLRTYYCFRNSLYIIFKYFYSNNIFAFNRIFNLCKEIYFILFAYPNKLQHLYFMIIGVIDFFRNKFGEYIHVK